MALWYATRAFGLVSMALLTAVMVLGLLVAGHRPARSRSSYVHTGLHRSLSLLAVVFVALHVLTSVADSYVTIRWVDAFVPFGAGYRPFWLGLGAVTLDLMIALTVTSLLRAHLRPGVWRATHWLAYACWPIALVHGVGAGTDTTVALVLAFGCVIAVAIPAARRVATARWRASMRHGDPGHTDPRPAGGAGLARPAGDTRPKATTHAKAS